MSNNVEQRARVLIATEFLKSGLTTGSGTATAEQVYNPVVAAVAAALRQSDEAHAALRKIFDAAGNPAVSGMVGQNALDATATFIADAIRRIANGRTDAMTSDPKIVSQRETRPDELTHVQAMRMQSVHVSALMEARELVSKLRLGIEPTRRDAMVRKLDFAMNYLPPGWDVPLRGETL